MLLSIYLCTTRDHNPWFVLAAALICIASSISGMLLLRRSIERNDRRWQALAGIATGFGLWCTHFIAMMGYRPGLSFGYLLIPTAASLLLVLVLVTAGFAVAAQVRGRVAAPLGAVIAGSGIAGMHYIGIGALDIAARMDFDPQIVALSLVLAIGPLIPALRLIRVGQGQGWGHGLIRPCLLLALAVVGLHFTGMAAIRLVPWRTDGAAPVMVSSGAMSAMVGTVAGLVVMVCIGVLIHTRRIDDLMRASERHFTILARGISDHALCMLTPDGLVAGWNVGVERLKGYEEDEVIGQSFALFYPPEERAQGEPERALAVAREQGLFRGQGWRQRKDGSRFWADVTIERIQDDTGRVIGFGKITRDMTRVKENQDRLAAMQAQRDTALDNMAQGLILYDADQRLLLANRRLCDLWQVPRETVHAGMSLNELLIVLTSGRAVAEAGPVMTRLQHVLVPRDRHAADGVTIDCSDDFALSVSCRPLDDGGWIATFTDITERRRDEARIAHMTRHDLLTGLPNREEIKHWIDAELVRAEEDGSELALVMLDLEAMRSINDRHGHSVGDRVLRTVAARLARVCADGERIARAGGDEFMAGKRLHDPAALGEFLDRLRACLAGPVIDDGLIIPVAAAIGVATFPDHGRDCGTLSNNADLALQRAKGGLGERLCIYDAGMDEDQRARRQLATDLRGAVQRGEMRLLFQPQHELTSGTLVGYEALVRWDHPTRGEVSPVVFIPIAEETGEIFAIGEWVLAEAARVAASWTDRLKIAVNLSPVQFEQDDLLQRIVSVLLDTALPTSRLEFEITESAIIADRERALHVLRRIKALGISIAIDDFGTGHSSLDTLHLFPFDKIKIDKFFLRHAASNAQSAAIVRAVLALGRGLAIPVLAEGIETEEQIAFLTAEGCELGQGYYFGRPQVVAAGPTLRPVMLRKSA